MSNQDRGNAFIGGMLIGGTIGAIVALLFAPRTGRETRRILSKTADALPEMAEDLSSTLQLNTTRLSASALKNWEGTLNRLKVAIASGIEASQGEIGSNLNEESTDRPNIN